MQNFGIETQFLASAQVNYFGTWLQELQKFQEF
jgi:hypothetical protein